MKKLALVVYPNFSMQEISSICGFFRWQYDCPTVVFSSSLNPVNSEEGLWIKPEKTFESFSEQDYHCLILPGCSDFGDALRDVKFNDFLKNFKDNQNFIIGAICSSPIFLAQAGLLHNKKFTCSLFVEALEWFTFIQQENTLPQPVVIDGNIITAVGFAFNEFALAVASKLGLEAPETIYSGVTAQRLTDPSLYQVHLPEEYIEEFKNNFSEYFDNSNQ